MQAASLNDAEGVGLYEAVFSTEYLPKREYLIEQQNAGRRFDIVYRRRQCGTDSFAYVRSVGVGRWRRAGWRV